MGGTWQRKYSVEQTAAIVRAIVDDGMKAPEACRRAAAGELYELSPFEYAVGTARDYAGAEKRKRRGDRVDRRRAAQDPEERIDALTQRGLAMLEHAMDRLEQKAGKDVKGYTPEHAAELKPILESARSVRALTRGMAPTRGGGRERREREAKGAAPKPEKPSDLVDELVRDHERTATGNGTQEHHGNGTGNGAGRGSATTQGPAQGTEQQQRAGEGGGGLAHDGAPAAS